MENIRLVSWNVNGLRAIWQKNFLNIFKLLNADIFAVQETKLQDHQLTDEMRHIEGYKSWWSYASTKKGYSGVGVYSRIEPKSVKYGIGIPKYDQEGRILELDFDDFVFFNIYFPNGKMNETRLKYKLDFYEAFFNYADKFHILGKPVIVTGDYNTAHNEIDLKNPKPNQNISGFLRVERDWLDKIIKNGYVDIFRALHPDTIKYSWWSYRTKARERNAGWRIDYFFITENLKDQIKEAFIDNSIMGSDHCPIGLDFRI